MTYEEKRKFLSQYKDYVLICKETKKQIVELREMQLPSSPLLDGMPKNPSREDHMARYAVKFSELVDKYDKAMAKVYEVHRAINALENTTEQYVLSAYYISGMRIWEIAEDTNYSERSIKNKKKAGIEHLDIKIKRDDSSSLDI